MDKTIGQIAHEAACDTLFTDWNAMPEVLQQAWEKMASAVAAAVKEEDARICDWLNGEKRLTPAGCAAAIRASIKEGK